MKKRFALFVFALLLASCQTNRVPSTPETTNTFSESTPTSDPRSLEDAPTSTPQSAAQLFPTMRNDFIVIGAQSNGIRLLIDPHSGETATVRLPRGCRILDARRVAICERAYSPSNRPMLYMMNLVDGATEDLPIRNLSGWSWTPDQDFLYYYLGSSSGDEWEFYSFDLDRMSSNWLGRIERGWYFLPQFSADGQFLIGVRPTEERPFGAITLVMGDSESSINSEEPWYVVDMAWSPTDQILGFIASDTIDPPFTYAARFMIYDALSGEIRTVSELPSGYSSYGLFYGFYNTIWSPDGSRVALAAYSEAETSSTTSLCIIHVASSHQTCFSLLRPGESLRRWTWSPDSRSIAYVFGAETTTQLGVLDIDAGESSPVVFELSLPANCIDELVWMQSWTP